MDQVLADGSSVSQARQFDGNGKGDAGDDQIETVPSKIYIERKM
jgi:hypothetical protein